MKTFRDAIRTEDFVVTATLPVSPDMTRATIQTELEVLQPLLHAIQIGDNWRAEGHMDILALAAIALDQGVDPVVHVTGRDRNRIALQGALLGIAGLGASSVILSRGQKLPETLRGKVKGVFDTEPGHLFETARRIGEDLVSPAGASLYIGTFAPVMNADPDWRANKIIERLDSGVRFIQTRPCLNIKMLRSYMDGIVRLKIPRRAAFIIDVPVVTSASMPRWVEDTFPGVRIPADLVRRISKHKDPQQAGIAVTADVVRQMATIPGVSGVNLLYEGSADIVAAVLSAAQDEP